MPKCAVWSCKNSTVNILSRNGVSFFHYPRDPYLASQWWAVLAPVLTSTFKPATAVVCSDHFHDGVKYSKTRYRLMEGAVPDLLLLGPRSAQRNRSSTIPAQHDVGSSDNENNMFVVQDIPENLRTPSESTVCRVCLASEGRMMRVTLNDYEETYNQVTGIKWNKEDKLPQHLCWECGHRLRAAAGFRRKAIAAHDLLQALRSDKIFLTLKDIKLIDREYTELTSTLSERHNPPNQYLPNATLDSNNEIFPQPESELKRRLKIGPDKEISEKDFVPLVNLERLAEKTQLTDNDVKLQIDADRCSITVTYKELNPAIEDIKTEPEDLSLPTCKSLENNIDDLSLETYKNLNDKHSYMPTYENNKSSTDTYSNTKVINNDSYETAYKNLGSNIENPKVPDTYEEKIANVDALVLAAYLLQESDKLQNSNTDTTYKNLEIDKPLPTDKVETNISMPELDVSKKTDMAPKKTDSSFRLEDDYDSDESDILVIDADRDNDLETMKSQYVGGSGGGMPIDELIDIYNNDGDGDGRLQQLNDDATEMERRRGGHKQADNDSRHERNAQDTAAELSEALLGHGLRSKAYKKLNQALFTFTAVSEAEQIEDISKRQNTSRFRCAPFKCHLCFRSFQVRRAYDTHMMKHDASSGLYECPVCRARQKSARAVKTHVYSQHTVRISCNACSFVTMNRSVARSHEKYHSGTVFKCPHCFGQFDQESTYRNHSRLCQVHAFACVVCGFAFVSRKGLAVHRCKRHADADQIPLLGPYCATCQLRFASEEAYARHLKFSSRHYPDNPTNMGLRDAGN